MYAASPSQPDNGFRPGHLDAQVSGCVRECAEAQSKDFGMIAVSGGYNIYVCGNGGAKPRHADLLAESCDEDTTLLYLDRFLMYYMLTADKLQRTAPWLDKLEGGIEHLKDVVIHDKLGICNELESRMGHLVDTRAANSGGPGGAPGPLGLAMP
jgi:nitrite reductase (NADH) large subunit